MFGPKANSVVNVIQLEPGPSAVTEPSKKKKPQKNLPFGNHGNGLDVRQQIHFGVFVKRQWKRLKRVCFIPNRDLDGGWTVAISSNRTGGSFSFKAF